MHCHFCQCDLDGRDDVVDLPTDPLRMRWVKACGDCDLEIMGKHFRMVQSIDHDEWLAKVCG
jgi:hypothetical protein